MYLVALSVYIPCINHLHHHGIHADGLVVKQDGWYASGSGLNSRRNTYSIFVFWCMYRYIPSTYQFESKHTYKSFSIRGFEPEEFQLRP
jgi:hypothetical protein